VIKDTRCDYMTVWRKKAELVGAMGPSCCSFMVTKFTIECGIYDALIQKESPSSNFSHVPNDPKLHFHADLSVLFQFPNAQAKDTCSNAS